uniref:Uncharacterized protein n=1 Tax=Romanomermis culicivorax TaxID=13658 RepID=A0A915IL00_ROMCU
VFSSKADFCRILESIWKAIEKENRSQILLISLVDMLVNQMEMFPSFHSICIWELYKVYASHPALEDTIFRKLTLRFNIERLRTIFNANLLSTVKLH